jgi:GTPase
VERTRILAYLIPVDSDDAQTVYERLRRELREYSTELHRKTHLILLTKSDLIPPGDPMPRVSAPEARATLVLSSAARSGLDDLKNSLWDLVTEARAADLVPEDEGIGDG